MRSCVAGRFLSAFLLLLVVLLLGALAPTRAADEDRFLTNLALLDVLADEAVEQILDSLGVVAGDSIAVLADGYNEGNDFMADAFARSLARRGCSWHVDSLYEVHYSDQQQYNGDKNDLSARSHVASTG